MRAASFDQGHAEWDQAFTYLANGNAELLEALYQRFAVGPNNWK